MEQYRGKKILLRVDLNIPITDGKILDDNRIVKIIPTINDLLKLDAKIILISHFGRPKNAFDPRFSLNILCKALSQTLKVNVKFCPEIGEKSREMASHLQPKEILLLENLRFYPGEVANDLEFAKELASLADFYINDSFSCSHRAHASIVKITEILPSAAGLLLKEEVESLKKYLAPPKKPMIAIIGGSKISTKLDLLYSLIEKADFLVVAGAMANTFLKALGYQIGNSFYEPELLSKAQDILSKSQQTACELVLPQDVVIAQKIERDAAYQQVEVSQVPEDQMILDIGPETILKIKELLQRSKTLIWNGPLGVFEYPPFHLGTAQVAEEVAKLTSTQDLISIAGGGDIIAALAQTNALKQFTYISTAGGAFLEWLEGKELPGLKALKM